MGAVFFADDGRAVAAVRYGSRDAQHVGVRTPHRVIEAGPEPGLGGADARRQWDYATMDSSGRRQLTRQFLRRALESRGYGVSERGGGSDFMHAQRGDQSLEI